ncbi:hypothetical protein N9948_00550 [bacterium]|nr:hypothetical protein [bacterium]
MQKKLRVYLAGKVDGNKWLVVPKDEDRFLFRASDGSNHSEHLSGICRYDFEECNNKDGAYADLVNENFIRTLKKSHMLIAFLDRTDSYGSIAEIAYASALGIPCQVIVQRKTTEEENEEWHPHDEDGMFDAYYFVCSFPNVQVTETQNIEESTQVAHKICSKEYGIRFVNSFKFIMN